MVYSRMVEDLSNASWDDILDHPQVIPLDSRKPIYVGLPHSSDTFVIKLNRANKSVSFAKTLHANPDQAIYQLAHFPYLLVNPDFEKLQTLIRMEVNAEQNSISLTLIKPADNTLFTLNIQETQPSV